MSKKALSPAAHDALLKTLKARFEKHMELHQGVAWAKIEKKLEAQSEKLWSLQEMEKTGGEPDVVGQQAGAFIFVDCSEESPKGRRSLCYDDLALRARKEHKPKDSALNLAKDMGIELLSEEDYRELQKLGEFDLKTSSWIQTPKAIRVLGGALFCDRRYDTIFTYHNGAESYYAARGFRGLIRV